MIAKSSKRGDLRVRWIKKGLIIKPGRFTWMVTHAQNPFPERIGEDRYKIHFAGRDKYNRARGGYAVIDINEPERILETPEKPLLDLGALGCFDDCGVMPSCIVNYKNNQYMYYTGWTQAVVTPFSFFIGLAISRDGGKTFERFSEAPVLGRNIHDPYLTCSPWVIIENEIWRMWYVSGTGWEIVSNDPKPKHYYHIRYAESKDGMNWDTSGIVCIDYSKDEYAIARPTVYKEEGLYKMWYCYRGGANTYRAGYAESTNGIDWERKDDQVGIDVSESGWDSYMICYPCVFEHKGKKYMLYNGGRNFGENGCGLAVLDENG